MQHTIRQLERVRRVGRSLLFAQRLLQWLAVLLLAALACGLIDYGLRLPGWLRLALGLGVAGGALYWLTTRCLAAASFKPDLSVLALRAERLYPQLAGRLATGVEFAAAPETYADPRRTALLAQASVGQARAQAQSIPLTRLIDYKHTLQLGMIFMAMLMLTGGVALANFENTGLALRRWLMPLGDAQWPRWTNLQSLVESRFWPIDAPLELRTQVARGYQRGMRTWAVYRVRPTEGAPTHWQSVLMSEQSAGEAGDRTHDGPRVFERVLDISSELAQLASASRGAVPSLAGAQVEFYFEAGDDATAEQSLELVARPAATAVRVRTSPPAYAQGLVNAQDSTLDQQDVPIASVAALAGSRVELIIELNKPVQAPGADWAQTLPGFAPAPQVDADMTRSPPTIAARFALTQTVLSPVHLVDEHGLTNLSERQYRIEAVPDKSPVVSIVEPAADESVLATAVIDVEALARDDVGADSLSLEAQLPARAGPPDSAATPQTRTLTRIAGRQPQLSAKHNLDLSPMSLRPGDEVALTAIAQDVYEFDGQRHEPVRSAPRRLRIIDPATLLAQIRTELAGLRQQAIRLADRQRAIMDQQPEQSQPRQQQLTGNLATQNALVNALAKRMERNRLDDPQTSQVLRESAKLLEEAQSSSRSANQNLQDARETPSQAEQDAARARADQENVGESLSKLVALLDQGRDALAAQIALQQLLTRQANLAADAKAMLPRTMGKPVEGLTPEEKKRIDDLAASQANLADQAKNLVQQMQASSESIAQQSQSPNDQAAAEALAQAAAIAQRQGLTQNMQQASKSAGQNQLGASGDSQSQSMNTMQEMLSALQDQEKLRVASLRRRLMKLTEAIKRLIAQQESHLALTTAAQADALPALSDPLQTLRRNTVAVQQDAAEDRGTQEVAQPLGKAADQQGLASESVARQERDPGVTHQKQSLADLRQALDMLEKMRRDAQAQANREQRKKLREEYERLAKEQDDLRETATPISTLAPDAITRAQRATLVDLGHRESDLRSELRELASRVDEFVVFKHLHQEIDVTASRVADELRAARVDGVLIADERDISDTLRTLASALTDDQKQDPFAESPGSPAGGGGGGSPPLIPPFAELKALRGMQDSLYRRTRIVAGEPEAGGQRERHLLRLGGEQRKLSGLGESLIEQMQTGPKPGPDGAPQ